MVIARKSLIRDGEIGTYHVISRCVRRSWLCGVDPYSGKDYSHRKEWVRNRLKVLSEQFSSKYVVTRSWIRTHMGYCATDQIFLKPGYQMR